MTRGDALPQPRRRFGQHFLANPGVVTRICETLAPAKDDKVVEIGPGRGALTFPLAQRLHHLHVIEIDRDLAAFLAASLDPMRVTIHNADALQFDLAALGGPLRLIGNLPYNISTPLLFRFAEFADTLRDLHFMLQREVVERMAAVPGSAEYGRLSVMLQYRFDIEALFRVSPGSFIPPPQVESALVRLRPHAYRHGRARDERLFAQLVAAAFGQRRKMLRNTLAPWFDSNRLAALDIDPRQRGETLGVADYLRLSDALLQS